MSQTVSIFNCIRASVFYPDCQEFAFAFLLASQSLLLWEGRPSECGIIPANESSVPFNQGSLGIMVLSRSIMPSVVQSASVSPGRNRMLVNTSSLFYPPHISITMRSRIISCVSWVSICSEHILDSTSFRHISIANAGSLGSCLLPHPLRETKSQQSLDDNVVGLLWPL